MSAPSLRPEAVIKEVLKTKSGIVAAILLLLIISLVIAVPIYAPYDVVKTWNDPEAWLSNPKNAAPIWVERLIGKRLPRNIFLGDENFSRRGFNVTYRDFTIKKIILRARFEYPYDDFPSHIRVEVLAKTNSSLRVSAEFIRPDGAAVQLFDETISREMPRLLMGTEGERFHRVAEAFYLDVTGRRPEAVVPEAILMASKESLIRGEPEVLKGRYALRLEVTSFNLSDDVEVELQLYGRVYGLAGTDSKGRDLLIGILWGAPVALAFSLTAAVVSTLIQTLFGILSGYLGGRVDEVIQRFTEFMMIIPMLPIMILVSFVYRISIWTLLVIVIVFSLVGSTTKVVRSMVPQIKEESYILAAISYGASPWRIMFLHIFPRVLPYTFSILALSVPGYVFLEAALSYLGLGDPVLPTWGRILGDAYTSGAAYYGYWWWILIPAGCIMMTALAFALLGYAFDKVVNPRLREM